MHIIKKILFLFIFTLICDSAKAQETATLLYNWQDTTLVSSWTYDNTYNECWGLLVNNREFAVIGSTAGTHFDITDPQNSLKLLSLLVLTQVAELYTEITTIFWIFMDL